MSHELVSGTILRRKGYTTNAYSLAPEMEIMQNNAWVQDDNFLPKEMNRGE